MKKNPKQLLKERCYLLTKVGLINYLLIRSSIRRTQEICVDEKAQVKVLAPFHRTQGDIEAFIHEKALWIVNKTEQMRQEGELVQKKKFDHGSEFLFLGKKYKLEVEERNTHQGNICFDGFKWNVTLPFDFSFEERQERIKILLVRWYRLQAEEILGIRVFHHARRLGVEPHNVAIRTQKRVWGNCDCRTKTIRLNWQIIFSPLKVIDYVVVHELCHLMVPNHSRRFWKKVEKFMPDFRDCKKWLHRHTLDMVLPY